MYGMNTDGTALMDKILQYPEEYTDVVMAMQYDRMVEDCFDYGGELPF